MFNSASEAIYWIEHIKRKEKRTDLSRIKNILASLGHPEEAYKKVHIAGTNGKGATCEMISSILIAQGYSVARFVSPYIINFNERIVVNKKPISDLDLLRLTNYLYPIIEEYNKVHDDIVPFFEVVTILGFLYFKEQNVDYAIIECGLGGKLDATNCINSICSVIPTIGYDHMKVLGDTLEEIANHKLGILKENTHLITGVSKELYNQFDDYAKKMNSSIDKISLSDLSIKSSLDKTEFILDGIKYQTNLIGSFEALNAALAIKTVKYLDNNINDETINKALLNIFWPGRLEKLSSNPLILMDGGHNISAVNQVVESIKEITNKRFNIIYTGLSDKETSKVINKLEEIADEMIITHIDDPRCKDIDELFNEVKIDKKTKIYDEFEAFDYSLKSKKDTLIIGSLHFVSSLREYAIKKLK